MSLPRRRRPCTREKGGGAMRCTRSLIECTTRVGGGGGGWGARGGERGGGMTGEASSRVGLRALCSRGRALWWRGRGWRSEGVGKNNDRERSCFWGGGDESGCRYREGRGRCAPIDAKKAWQDIQHRWVLPPSARFSEGADDDHDNRGINGSFVYGLGGGGSAWRK